MGQPIVIPPRHGEIIGDAPDRRVEILSDCDGLHATWSRFGPGRDGADLHIHYRHTDLFYVLEGELTMRLGAGGEEARAPAGALVRVPPGVVHGFRNAGDREVRYLNLHAPGVGFADYMRAMRDGRSLSYDQFDPPEDGGRPITEVRIGAEEPVLADVEAIRIEVRSADAAPGADEHGVHSLYVLDGDLALTVGDDRITAEPGTWIQIPAGTPHAADGAARYLSISSPT